MDAQTAVRIHTDNGPEMTHLSVWICTDNNTNHMSRTHANGPSFKLVFMISHWVTTGLTRLLHALIRRILPVSVNALDAFYPFH